MPKLISFYIRHCVIGFGLSALFIALLLWLDVAGLRGLISGDPMGWLALLMLWLFNGSVFGAVQFAIAVMGMRRED